MSAEATKYCWDCKEIKPLTDFYKNVRTHDGLQNRCKFCALKTNAEWRKQNAAYLKGYDSKRKKVPFNELARMQVNMCLYPRRRICNVCKIEKLAFDFYKDKRTFDGLQKKCKQCQRDWNRSDKQKTSIKKYRRNNPGYWRNQEARRRALESNATGSFTRKDVDRLYEHQNGQCNYCRKDLNNKFHVDHIIPLSKNGTNFPDNLQLLCAFCNLSKGDKLPSEINVKMIVESSRLVNP